MRTFFSVGRLIFVAVIVSMLASCASLMPNTTHKKLTTPTDSSCHNWCHNGWCSKHCDDGDGN